MRVLSALKICAALSFLILASGCTDADWDRLNAFPDLGGPPPRQAVEPAGPEAAMVAAPPPSSRVVAPVEREAAQTGQPIMAAPLPGAQDRGPAVMLPSGRVAEVASRPALVVQPGNDFCHKVALQTGEQALEAGFTPATAQLRYDDKLRDCEAIMAQ